MPRARFLSLVLALGVLAACGRDPTGPQRIGDAEVTLTTASGARQIGEGKAGAFPYSPGPTSDTRSLVLRLTAGDTAGVGVQIEFLMRLPSNQDLPNPGTYVLGYTEGALTYVAYGDNLIWVGNLMKQYGAYGPPSTLTIETATPEVVTGRFTMEATEQNGSARVTVSGVFSAARVGRFQDLPRQR